MTKGRKPKPTHLRLLTGNPSGRKLNKNEPKYSKIEVEPPEHLDNAAKAEWGRVYGEMAAQGMITVVDRAALSAYCVSYSRWVKAETKLALMMEKSDDNFLWCWHSTPTAPRPHCWLPSCCWPARLALLPC